MGKRLGQIWGIVLMEEAVVLVFFMLGASLGSFANAWAYRYVAGESIAMGRSRCPMCMRIIPWYLNVPLFSFLVLRGRCNWCNTKISFRYPLVEFIFGFWSVFLLIKFGISFDVVFYIFVGLFLLILSLVDLDTMILPDSFILLVSAVLFCGGIILDSLSIYVMLSGAVVGSFGFYLVAFIYKFLRKRDGLGMGDVKLMIPLGAMSGIYGLPLVVLVASLSGVLFYALQILKGRQTLISDALPFGPFLCFGACVELLCGNYIYAFYIF